MFRPYSSLTDEPQPQMMKSLAEDMETPVSSGKHKKLHKFAQKLCTGATTWTNNIPYSQLYTSHIIPVLTHQKDVEAVMLDYKAKPHLYAEVMYHLTASAIPHCSSMVLTLPLTSMHICRT